MKYPYMAPIVALSVLLCFLLSMAPTDALAKKQLGKSTKKTPTITHNVVPVGPRNLKQLKTAAKISRKQYAQATDTVDRLDLEVDATHAQRLKLDKDYLSIKASKDAAERAAVKSRSQSDLNKVKSELEQFDTIVKERHAVKSKLQGLQQQLRTAKNVQAEAQAKLFQNHTAHQNALAGNYQAVRAAKSSGLGFPPATPPPALPQQAN